jgi:hypothetical protein
MGVFLAVNRGFSGGVREEFGGAWREESLIEKPYNLRRKRAGYGLGPLEVLG